MSSELGDDVTDRLADSFDSLDELAPPVGLEELANWPAQQSERSSGAPPINSRLRRQLVGLAALGVALIGAAGVWLVIDRRGDESPTRPADAPAATTAAPPATTVAATIEAEPKPASTSTPPARAAERSLVERVAASDPWTAAQLFTVDAQYVASPAQAADLVVANELTSRACYEQHGIDIADFDPVRLGEWERYELSRWEARRAMWTPDGQQRLRREGSRWLAADEPVPYYAHMTAPVPEQCYPAATGVTFLGGTVVWSEDQLQTTLLEGDPQWQPGTWAFGRLPGSEDAKAAVEECMVERGWDEWRQPGAYEYLYAEPEASESEIAQMNDLIDCNEQADATEIFLTASADYVEDFRAEFADPLEQIEAERADALAQAYDILRAAGLDPLSD